MRSTLRLGMRSPIYIIPSDICLASDSHRLRRHTAHKLVHQFILLKLSVPNSYYQIANNTGNFSVMVLPILSTYTLVPDLYLGMSMYYQTVFQKPIISGYTSRENSSEEYPRLNIPLSVIAASLQAGGPFSTARRSTRTTRMSRCSSSQGTACTSSRR